MHVHIQLCKCFDWLSDPRFNSLTLLGSDTNLMTPHHVLLITDVFELKRLSQFSFTQEKVPFGEYFCRMSASASREKGHFSFLSHTSSRNIIPSSVCADQILGRRKGARLGGGQTKVHIPASQGTLALLPPPAVPFSSVNGDTEATVMSCSCIQQVVRGGCGQEGALVRKAGTHSQPWTAPRISDSAHGHLQAHTSPKPKTKLDPTATLPSDHPPGARHVIHLSSLRLPHRAGLEPRSSLYQSPRDRPPSEVASCFPAESRQLGRRAGAGAGELGQESRGRGRGCPSRERPVPRPALACRAAGAPSCGGAGAGSGAGSDVSGRARGGRRATVQSPDRAVYLSPGRVTWPPTDSRSTLTGPTLRHPRGPAPRPPLACGGGVGAVI